ncbi:hypothetical protein VCSRO105_2718 [Vibrio cholerae]|nr:hypothetical protein VCSRO105_2718 [Vibrio cholerae]
MRLGLLESVTQLNSHALLLLEHFLMTHLCDTDNNLIAQNPHSES